MPLYLSVILTLAPVAWKLFLKLIGASPKDRADIISSTIKFLDEMDAAQKKVEETGGDTKDVEDIVNR